MKHRPIWILGILLLLVSVSSASARIFTITLTNGTTFESRYRPQEVDWDDQVVVLVTDRGNEIALRKDEIADVTSLAEARGFGYQVDTTTIYLGFSPNDLVSEDDEGNQVTDYELPDAPSSGPSYSLGLFANTSDGASGIPLTAAAEE